MTKRQPDYVIRHYSGCTPNDLAADIAFQNKRSLRRQRVARLGWITLTVLVADILLLARMVVR